MTTFVVTRTTFQGVAQTDQVTEGFDLAGMATSVLMNEARDLMDAGFRHVSTTGLFPETLSVWDKGTQRVTLAARTVTR